MPMFWIVLAAFVVSSTSGATTMWLPMMCVPEKAALVPPGLSNIAIPRAKSKMFRFEIVQFWFVDEP